MSYLEGSLQQGSVRREHHLQPLPRVLRDPLGLVEIHAVRAARVSALAFHDNVVVVAVRAARPLLAAERRGIVDEEEAAAHFDVLLHRVHDSCREIRRGRE